MKRWLIFVGEGVGEEIFNRINLKTEIDLVYEVHQIEQKNKFIRSQIKYSTSLLNKEFCDQYFGAILIWWPKILSLSDISLLNHNIYNLHPSYLPFGRGKDPNFWAIYNQEPAGFTVHKINEKIDQGYILWQRAVPISFKDTGQILYYRIITEIKKDINFIIESITSDDIFLIPVDTRLGSYHNRADMLNLAYLNLDNEPETLDVINLMRAKTFTEKGGLIVSRNGKEFRLQLTIEDIDDG